MNSSERLERVLAGIKTDRTVISMGAAVGWNPDAWRNKAPSWARLMERVRQDTDCIYQTGVGVSEEGQIERGSQAPTRAERLSVWPLGGELNVAEFDCTVREWREGASRFTKAVCRTSQGELRGLWRTDDGLHSRWTIEHPCKSVDDLEAWLTIPWEPGAPNAEPLRRSWERLDGRHGLPMISGSDPICIAGQLMAFADFLVAAFTETNQVLKVMDAIHQRQMEELRRIVALPEMRGCIYRIVGPELATPPYLPPKMFERFVTCYIRPMVDVLRGSDIFTRVHCHGKIGAVVDQLVDVGIQGIDPCEPPPDGDVTLAELRKRHPDLVLFGNIEPKEIASSSEERVRQLVRTAIREAAGGPLVLMPCGEFTSDDLDPKAEQNCLAMIDEALAVPG